MQALQRAGAEEEAQLLQQHQQQQQQQAFHPHPQQPPGLPPLDKEKSAARLSRYATCYSEHPSGALGECVFVWVRECSPAFHFVLHIKRLMSALFTKLQLSLTACSSFLCV